MGIGADPDAVPPIGAAVEPSPDTGKPPVAEARADSVG